MYLLLITFDARDTRYSNPSYFTTSKILSRFPNEFLFSSFFAIFLNIQINVFYKYVQPY